MNKVEKVKAWAALLSTVRRFFDSRGYFEVTTPSLMASGGFEGTIDLLKVSFSQGNFNLHSSPEVEMKHLLAETRLDSYQVAKCYRDDPQTGIHLPEFTMLEFYKVGVSYLDMLAETKALFETLAGHALPFEEMTVRDAFKRWTDFEPNIDDDESEDRFFLALIEKIEPAFPKEKLVVLKEWPVEVSALAKGKAGTRDTERFEIYWRGMELCNGCTELDDVVELDRRFSEENRKRVALGKSPHVFPARLTEALEKGFPPCAGVAVGLDRLFACLNNEIRL